MLHQSWRTHQTHSWRKVYGDAPSMAPRRNEDAEVYAKSQFSRLSKQERRERFNRAQDFFGDPVQRRDDRLTFEGKSNIEEYIRGRMALVLHLEILSPEFSQSNRPGLIRNQDMPSQVLILRTL
jgi:hypothetical protein